MSLVFVGCHDNDEDYPTQYQFNPPAWIQGQWKLDGTKFRISNNDVIEIDNAKKEISYKEIINRSKNEKGKVINFREKFSETVYSFVIMMGNTTIDYEFKKKNPTELEWTSNENNQKKTFSLTKE